MRTSCTRTLGVLVVLALASPGLAFHYPWDQGHDTFTPTAPVCCKNPLGPPAKCPFSNASPVYAADGDFVRSFTDLVFTTVGDPVALARTYNSQDDRNGPLGIGWTFGYEVQAIPVTDGIGSAVIIRMVNGQRLRFARNPDGTFTAPPGSTMERLTTEMDGSLVLHLSAGVQWQFDTATRLRAVVDRNGNRTLFDYDPVMGCLKGVGDEASGRSLTIAHGPNGKIASATDPAGNVVRYGYDATGRLTSVKDQLGNATTYEYDATNRLTRVADARGVELIKITYDDQQRVSTLAEQGVLTRFEYQQGRTIKRDSADNATVLDLTPEGLISKITDPVGGTTTRVYDAGFRISSETDPTGFTTTFEHDDRGNVTRMTEYDGAVTSYTYDPVFNRATSVTDPTGSVQRFDYDAKGNLLRMVRDAGGPQQTVATEYAYDVRGNLVRWTTAGGQVSTFEYDAAGNVTRRTDPMGGTLTRTYDVLGRTRTSTDALGRTTAFEYDARGQLTAVVDPLGARTTFVWNASGDLVRMTDALGQSTVLEHDLRDVLVRLTDPAGHQTQRTYEPRDNSLATVIEPDGATTTFVHDAAGRLTTSTDPLGKVTRYTHDGNGLPTAIQTADGSVLAIEYDGRNQPTRVTDPLGNVTSQDYDSRKLRTGRTDANGSTTHFTYDRLQNLTAIVDPLGRRWTFTYDAGGNPVSRTDPLGQTIRFEYDKVNRLVTTRYPDGTHADRAYDAVGNLLSLVDPSTDLAFTYDQRSRLVQLRDNKLGKTVTYTYDALDRRATMTGPEGALTTYGYDADSLLTRVARGGSITRQTYNTDHTLAQVLLPNGTTRQLTYDAANRIANVTYRQSGGQVLESFAYARDAIGNVTGVTRESGDVLSYTYDAAHRLTGEARTGSQAYDMRYTYDAAGNRLSFGTGCGQAGCSSETTYRYDAASELLQELQPTATITYGYDANGNLVQKTDGARTWTFAYDVENRLSGIDAPGTADDATYVYDADGKRIEETVGGSTRRFFYERADEFYLKSPLVKAAAALNRWLAGTNVLAEYDTGGHVVAQYLNSLGLDMPIARQPAGGTDTYYLQDALRSVTGLVDPSQNLVGRYDYSAYGAETATTGSASAANPQRFTGGRRDGESGLYYLRNRYYDPSAGRFLTRDPMLEYLDRTQQINEQRSPLFEQVQQPHAYGYSSENPTNLTDPMGTSLLVVCSLGLPACSAALICSLNIGICSGGLACSFNIGACSAATACSGTAAGVCSGGIVCSGNAGPVTQTACSGAVACSMQAGWVGNSACSAAIAACSGQIGLVGNSACSASAMGVCSGQAGAVGLGACSLQVAGACSAQALGQGSACSAQGLGGCSGQYGYGPGVSVCSAQVGGIMCSGQGGPGFPAGICSAQIAGSCSASDTPACSAQYDQTGRSSCSKNLDSNGKPCGTDADSGADFCPPVPIADGELPWRLVLSSLGVERESDGAVSVAWAMTTAVRRGRFSLQRSDDQGSPGSVVAEGDLTSGQVKEVRDPDGAAAYLLRLEVGGRVTTLGPLRPGAGTGSDLAPARTASLWQWLLDRLTSRAEARAPAE